MLRRHYVIGAAISFAGNNSYFRDSAFGIGIQQLSTMLDNTALFLPGPWHEARDIDKGEYWNIKRIAKAYEARSLFRGINV